MWHGNSNGPLICVFLNNQLCQGRPTLVDIDSNETLFYIFIVSVNKCGGNCSTIDDPYVLVCIPNKVKDMNVKAFNSMMGVNETKFLV